MRKVVIARRIERSPRSNLVSTSSSPWRPIQDTIAAKRQKRKPQKPRHWGAVYFTTNWPRAYRVKAFNKMWSRGEKSGLRRKDYASAVSRQASECREKVKCGICRSTRHPELLHLSCEEKKQRSKEMEPANGGSEVISLKCTSFCKGLPGGPSCSKIVLVDV